MLKLYHEFWKSIFVWKGTENRREYWAPFLINLAIVIVIGVLTGHDLGEPELDHLSMSNMIFLIIPVILIVAEFTSTARRLHDTNHSNWWAILDFIPWIGWTILIIMLLLPSKKGRWSN